MECGEVGANCACADGRSGNILFACNENSWYWFHIVMNTGAEDGRGLQICPYPKGSIRQVACSSVW